MVQNWYKGQISAHAIMPMNTKSSNNKDSYYSSNRDDGYLEQINSSIEDKKIRCIFCNKNGHSAQVCRRLIDWLSKQKSKKKEQQKSSNEYANFAIENYLDDNDIGC